MSSLMNIILYLNVAFLVNIGLVSSIPTFTGHADTDFGALTGRDVGAYHQFISEIYPYPTDYMVSQGRFSGFDIQIIHVFYDDQKDDLYFGIQCNGICGDSDGDGNPSGTDVNDPNAGEDAQDMCGSESMVVLMWNNVPEDYVPDPYDSSWYFPNTVVGDNFAGCIVDNNGVQTWLAREFPGYKRCQWPTPLIDPFNSCVGQQQARVRTTDLAFNDLLILSEKWKTNSSYGVMDMPKMHTLYPNASNPHIEYVLGNFTNYPEMQDFVAGVTPFRLAISAFAGSVSDKVGEDYLDPQIWEFTYDCAGNPKGNATYDECGVCNGNNDTCDDCLGIPNGIAEYDECGVCNGNNTTCMDCNHIPNGPAEYDECGVCDGRNTTCMDCAHIPNGKAEYDACGVCDGKNTTCMDCDHIPNGHSQYDECGVCKGDNRTCRDCFGEINGFAKYDNYGICNGTNFTDCFHNPYGNATYDNCGVCGGADETCTCYGYLGYKAPYLCYALLRWTIAASRVKITDTLDVLYAIKHELPYYDYKSDSLELANYIDTIHNFCDNCLDNFDFAQVWFADRLAGNCIGADCEGISMSDFSWSL